MISTLASHAPMIGLLFFFAVFVGVAVWTYRPGGRPGYDRNAQIPLTEDHHDAR